ncbi:MAG TPA: hypothetical protein VEK07_01095 [Polyangiaceae bacterium]|nr:hypothetical protein [Polyangiaceae bacterium]
MEDNSRDMKAVYTVVDRGQGKSFWIRIGVGFTNRDGSLNLRLDAIPVNGTLQVRDWEPHDRKPEVSDAPLLRPPRPKTREPSGDAVAEG